MNTNRLVLTIAATFSLFLHLPRIAFLYSGQRNQTLEGLIQVTVEDTALRILLLFGYAFTLLKLNLDWVKLIPQKHRRWAALLANLLIYFIWVLLFYLIETFFYNIFASVISPSINFIVYFFFLIVLAVISYAVKLLKKSRLDNIEKEVLKRKSLQNELEALRNQVNPHFLFNSLSTLLNLVREDQKSAETFIYNLAFLYRYILQSQEEELATIKDELKVLNSYAQLIGERYKDNFRIDVRIDESVYHRKIPILSLQLLLENAVKHNEISHNKPLLVEIFSDATSITVKNPLQLRTHKMQSTQKGLKNLSTRTQLLFNKPLVISKSETSFVVKIPLS